MSGTPLWDAEAAEAETRASLAEILSGGDLKPGVKVMLDLRFAPGPAADRAGFIAAMRAAGYAGNAYEAEGREEIEAVVPHVPLAPDAVWAEEQKAAAIALA
ncbi:MAG: hypothetical protein AAFQ81_06740, partial [Pseudomonadota bacterium]